MIKRILPALAVFGSLGLSVISSIPAQADIVKQVSDYTFDAKYNGNYIDNYVKDTAAGSLHQNEWLNKQQSATSSQSSSSVLHKDESGNASVVQSGLNVQAIPGYAPAGMAVIGGQKSSFSNVTNISASQTADATSSSSLNQSAGLNKNFTNEATHQQNGNTYNFAQGQLSAGQTAVSFPSYKW